MDILQKKKKPFIRKDDVVEDSGNRLLNELVTELREKGCVAVSSLRVGGDKKNRHAALVILGQLYMHEFLYSQIHKLDDYTLSRTYYTTKKFDDYVNEKKESEIR